MQPRRVLSGHHFRILSVYLMCWVNFCVLLRSELPWLIPLGYLFGAASGIFSLHSASFVHAHIRVSAYMFNTVCQCTEMAFRICDPDDSLHGIRFGNISRAFWPIQRNKDTWAARRAASIFCLFLSNLCGFVESQGHH